MRMQIRVFENENEEMTDENVMMSWAANVKTMSEIPEQLRMAATQLDESEGKPAFVDTALGAMPYNVYASLLENGIFEE